MMIEIVKLKSGLVDKIEIDETYSFSPSELKNSGIISLDNVKVKGVLEKNEIDDYNLKAKVYGTMILPCSLSLKPTNYDFDIEIDGEVGKLLEEIGKTLKNDENSIDILPIIWENILMEVPMYIVNEDIHDVKMQGDGWKIITEENKDEEENSELAKLKDLL